MSDKIILTPIEARILLDKCNKNGNMAITHVKTSIGNILLCTPQSNMGSDINTWEDISDYDSW